MVNVTLDGSLDEISWGLGDLITYTRPEGGVEINSELLDCVLVH